MSGWMRPAMRQRTNRQPWKLPDRCHRAKTRNEENQQAAHSLGKTAVLRYTHHAETPTRQVGFSLSLALVRWVALSSVALPVRSLFPLPQIVLRTQSKDGIHLKTENQLSRVRKRACSDSRLLKLSTP